MRAMAKGACECDAQRPYLPAFEDARLIVLDDIVTCLEPAAKRRRFPSLTCACQREQAPSSHPCSTTSQYFFMTSSRRQSPVPALSSAADAAATP